MSQEYKPEPHPFSDRELDFGQYVLTHRPMWRRALVFILYFITLLIIFQFSVKWTIYLTDSLSVRSVEYGITQNTIPFAAIRASRAPEQPRVHSIAALASGEGRIDVTAQLSNPNTQWRVAKIDYQFSIDGQAQGVRSTFLVPTESQHISVFNVASSSRQPTVRVDILDIRWQRVHDRAPLESLSQLVLEDVTYGNNTDLGTFEVAATLANTSGKSFWVVGLYAVAKRFGEYAGINYIAVEQVRSGSRHDVRFVWPTALSGIDTIEIMPVVDVFNDAVYMPPHSSGFPLDPSGVDF